MSNYTDLLILNSDSHNSFQSMLKISNAFYIYFQFLCHFQKLYWDTDNLELITCVFIHMKKANVNNLLLLNNIMKINTYPDS